MKVVLHQAAENDIAEAAVFYESTGSPALAAKFVAEFKRVAQLLLESPARYRPAPVLMARGSRRLVSSKRL